MEKYLECAKITTTHGVRGGVRLENRCDSPETLASLKSLYKKNKKTGEWEILHVTRASVQKSMVLATFREIEDMDAAIALRDTVLYADRADIPLAEGAHFIADLIGLPVIDAASGEKLGVVEDVISPAGQDIYVVRRGEGTFMIPAVPAFIQSVALTDTDAPGIYVTLIEGMTE